ncbi:membrane-associated phospholipase C 1 plcA [Mycobacterium haemophilum DSM 44634]|uniref:hypothetical protein n=1 Tax=Mycobacterium haemophilum TaxID=29311 RepID=UPI0006D47E85|nr:hypothetical protein B586_20110 [Mycobacterium haemophilum DSM 44634]
MTTAFNVAVPPNPSRPNLGYPVVGAIPKLPQCVPNVVLGSTVKASIPDFDRPGRVSSNTVAKYGGEQKCAKEDGFGEAKVQPLRYLVEKFLAKLPLTQSLDLNGVTTPHRIDITTSPPDVGECINYLGRQWIQENGSWNTDNNDGWLATRRPSWPATAGPLPTPSEQPWFRAPWINGFATPVRSIRPAAPRYFGRDLRVRCFVISPFSQDGTVIHDQVDTPPGPTRQR